MEASCVTNAVSTYDPDPQPRRKAENQRKNARGGRRQLDGDGEAQGGQRVNNDVLSMRLGKKKKVSALPIALVW